jgi:putative flippase GtrA
MKRELIKFTAFGLVAVLVDLVVYTLLLKVMPNLDRSIFSTENLSKAGSFMSGMVFSYYANKHFTWKEKNRSKRRLAKFSTLYGFSLILNVATNASALALLAYLEPWYALPHPYLWAFMCATGVSAGLNFAGQKWWVFKKRPDLL